MIHKHALTHEGCRRVGKQTGRVAGRYAGKVCSLYPVICTVESVLHFTPSTPVHSNCTSLVIKTDVRRRGHMYYVGRVIRPTLELA